MLPAQTPRHDWPDAPLPAPMAMCHACETLEVCPDGNLPDGWDTETLAGTTRAYCPDCAADLPANALREDAPRLFEASLYADDEPLAAVVHCKGRWFGLSHVISGRVLAHQFGEFGFWRVKGSAR